jgi:hypothetical protein
MGAQCAPERAGLKIGYHPMTQILAKERRSPLSYKWDNMMTGSVMLGLQPDYARSLLLWKPRFRPTMTNH